MTFSQFGKLTARLSAVLMCATLVTACATRPPADDPEAVAEFEQINDPFEPANRAIFGFNQAVDKAVIRPVAQAYRDVVPEFGRMRVRDFLANLRSPVVFANQLLQGDGDGAWTTLGRFCINTTFGVLGIMDVASEMGLKPEEEDFGQTMAVWGFPEGPYLVLPILGPSNPRDAVGLVADFYIDPITHWSQATSSEWEPVARTGATTVDTREGLLDVLDETERTSLDYYSSLRSLYRQRRAAAISDGNGDDIGTPSGVVPGFGPSLSPR